MSYPLNKVCAVVLLSLAVPATADAQPCRTQSLSGASYLVCSFDLTRGAGMTASLIGPLPHPLDHKNA
jgi:hypothetical protein